MSIVEGLFELGRRIDHAKERLRGLGAQLSQTLEARLAGVEAEIKEELKKAFGEPYKSDCPSRGSLGHCDCWKRGLPCCNCGAKGGPGS